MCGKIVKALAIFTVALVALSALGMVILNAQLNKASTPPEDLPNIYANGTIPEPPGTHSDLDQMWRDCATQNRRAVCDELFHKLVVGIAKYQAFGASCGGRVEILYPDVDCSQQLALQDNPPTIPALPWDMEIERLCLEVSETYADVEGDITPIHNALVSLMGDPNVLDEPLVMIADRDCDASVEIEVWGTALSEHYGGLEGERYTGAEIRGTIRLSAAGQETLISEIYRDLEPLDSLYVAYTEGSEPRDPGYKTPANAPFCSAAEGDILDAFKEWFGPNLLRNHGPDLC